MLIWLQDYGDGDNDPDSDLDQFWSQVRIIIIICMWFLGNKKLLT